MDMMNNDVIEYLIIFLIEIGVFFISVIKILLFILCG